MFINGSYYKSKCTRQKKKEQERNLITALLQLSGVDQENIIQMEHFIQRPKNSGKDKI